MKINKLQLPGGLIRSFSFILLIFLFVKCTGPRGYDGLDGLDGTASYSALYDVDPLYWVGDADGYRVFLDVPEITNGIYDHGAVLVYRLFDAEPKSFNLLPYTYVDNALTVYMDFDAYVGGVDLSYKEIYDGVNDTYAPENLMSFKIIIIDAIPLDALKTMVDVSDFNAVTKMLKVDTGIAK